MLHIVLRRTVSDSVQMEPFAKNNSEQREAHC